MDYKPYPHQQTTINFYMNTPRAYDASDMGCGKTFCIIQDTLLRYHKYPGGKTLILAPKSLLSAVWEQDFHKFAPYVQTQVCTAPTKNREEAFAKTADVYITNIDALKWLAEQPDSFFKDYHTIVIDEATCFPAGTLINMHKGTKPIDKVQKGDIIETSTGMHTVTDTNKRLAGALIDINNGLLTCTPEHRIFTNEGWIEAQHLTKVHTLYDTKAVRKLWSDISGPEKRQSNPGFLQSLLCSELSKQESIRFKNELRWAPYAKVNGPNTKNMHSVQGTIQGEEQPAENVFQAMCGKTQIRKLRDRTRGISDSNIRTTSMESREDNVTRTLRENETDSQRERQYNKTRTPRGERSRLTRMRSFITDCIASIIPESILCYYASATRRLSYALQDRLCRPKPNDSNRGRWEQSQQQCAKNTGQEERSVPTGIRVDSITYKKLGSETYVYDLSVEESPTYYANGILVHNCVKHLSMRTRALMKIKKHFAYRRALSGSPTAGPLTDLFYQYLFLDDGRTLGNKFNAYRNQVQYAQQTGPSAQMVKWVNKPAMEPVIAQLVKPITIRHELTEVVDMPDRISYSYTFKPNAKIMKAYKEMKNHAMVQLNTGLVTAVNAASLTTKILQICAGNIYDENGVSHLVDLQRYELVLDLVQQTKHSVVFFNWTSQRKYLMEQAEKRGINACFIDGTVSNKDRHTHVSDFQAGKFDTIFLQIKAAAHGITLTKATHTIWCCPTYLADYYTQANARVFRIGQKQRTVTINVEAEGTIEEKVYKSLTEKLTSMELLQTVLGE